MVSNNKGQLYIVATPIGNLQDMTFRAVEVLKSVSLIAAEDTRHSKRLLDQYGVKARLISLHEHNEDRVLTRLLDQLNAGEDVALISDAGTPLISDPGFPLVRACHDQAIAVRAVPGPSALIAALSVAGLATDRFRFEGFFPRTKKKRRDLLERLSSTGITLIFYESSHRILETIQDMLDCLGPEREVVIARELTKQYETVRKGSLAEISEWIGEDKNQQRGELVVLIAGREPEPSGAVLSDETLGVLAVLLEELSVKQAAGLAARLTGLKRNALYQAALKMMADG